MCEHCGNYVAYLTNYASFLLQKCFSKHQKTHIIEVKTTALVRSILISADVSALSTFKMLADSC